MTITYSYFTVDSSFFHFKNCSLKLLILIKCWKLINVSGMLIYFSQLVHTKNSFMLSSFTNAFRHIYFPTKILTPKIFSFSLLSEISSCNSVFLLMLFILCLTEYGHPIISMQKWLFSNHSLRGRYYSAPALYTMIKISPFSLL